MTTYKLYSTGTATADGTASIDIRHGGKIVAVYWDLVGVSAGTAIGCWELSFGSTSAFTTNDSLSAISNASCFVSSIGSTNVVQNDLDIAVDGGERIYLHRLAANGTLTVGTARVYVLVQDGTMGQKPITRRR